MHTYTHPHIHPSIHVRIHTSTHSHRIAFTHSRIHTSTRPKPKKCSSDDGDVRADGLEDEHFLSIATLMVPTLSSRLEHVLCINLWPIAIPVTLKYPPRHKRLGWQNYPQTTCVFLCDLF